MSGPKKGDLLRTYDGKYDMAHWWRLAEQAQHERGKARLFDGFIEPGNLVFDIGSSRGMMTIVFNWLGAEVVAVDPLYSAAPQFVREFDWKFGDVPHIHKVAAAVSVKEGTIKFSVQKNLPYLSSCATWWMTKSIHAQFYNPRSTFVKEVEAVTLDGLIEEYGVPVFIKVDVEGFEKWAIRGLSQPVKGLSFEFHEDWLAHAADVVEHLDGLGCYRYNYALNNQGRYQLDEWIKGPALLEHLQGNLTKRGPGSWGDAYARLCGADCCGACDVAD